MTDVVVVVTMVVVEIVEKEKYMFLKRERPETDDLQLFAAFLH